MTDKVAVFLDVENLSGWLKADGGETLLERASELGRVVVRRAYGDFSLQAVSTRQPELNLLGFEFIHVYHPVKGKNSADIQIVVDVMEYLARIPDLEWFVLATGDSDFSPLFRRLRELGKSVVGVGPRSALSEAVKKTCNRFIYTDESSSSDTLIISADVTQLRKDALEMLERVLDKFPEGASLSVLKMEMLEIDPSFDERNLGFNQFLSFLQSAPEVVTLSQNKQTWNAKAAIDAAQLRKDALHLLERIIKKFPEATCLSIIKAAMLEVNPSFNERKLGFSKFLSFLQSAPQIVALVKNKQVWNAKAVIAKHNKQKNELKENHKNDKLVNKVHQEPTTEIYKNLIRKTGWRLCKISLLWDVITKLERHFSKGFTRKQGFEYLIEACGHQTSRGELRVAMYILHKAGFVIPAKQNQDEDNTFTVCLPESENIILTNVDILVLNRIINVCKVNNLPFVSKLAYPILINSYSEEGFNALLVRAEAIGTPETTVRDE